MSGDRAEAKRYSAVMVLKELAKASPAVIYDYVNKILELVWNTLRDSKLGIREGAAEALSATLYLISQRESSSRKQW